MAVGPTTPREFNEIMQGSPNKAPEKRAPVTVAIDDLQDAVNRVANTIDRITSKITPVLRSDTPAACGGGATVAQDASGSSQLVLTIDAETRRLHVLAEQLNALVNRVEL